MDIHLAFFDKQKKTKKTAALITSAFWLDILRYRLRSLVFFQSWHENKVSMKMMLLPLGKLQ